MTDQFKNWLRWLIKWEGTVYENDPDDPGGATKYGIDQLSHPKVNIRELTLEGASQIYWTDYWIRARCDALPDKVAEVVGNIAVNAGRGRSPRQPENAIEAQQAALEAQKQAEGAQKAALAMQAAESGISLPQSDIEQLRAAAAEVKQATAGVKEASDKLIEHTRQ